MDKTLLAQVSHVTVNFSYMGFSIDSEIPINAGSGGCTSCAVGGSCGSTN